MSERTPHVDVARIMHELGHYLPAQAPLKDFVHHNTLHAFQHLSFHDALQGASENLGYKTYLDLEDYRTLYQHGKIHPEILKSIILKTQGKDCESEWLEKLLDKSYGALPKPHIGVFRELWKKRYPINLDKETHPVLFRFLAAYLDQGISIWKFPEDAKGLLSAFRSLEANSYSSLLRNDRSRNLLLDPTIKLEDLLTLLVGDPQFFRQYVFDQQFAHPGWSGMVNVLGKQPQSLFVQKQISLHDLVFMECLLEIDALDHRLGKQWMPLSTHIENPLPELFGATQPKEIFQVLALWQEAFEWTYYDQVIKGLQSPTSLAPAQTSPWSFQAIFCIDDRCCSIRRYIERFAPDSSTYGTAGFFNIPFYFQPEQGKFMTKVCPAPITPKHLIREKGVKLRHYKDNYFSKHTKGIVGGWLTSQTMGVWAALKLAKNMLKPGPTPSMVSSFQHMDPKGHLSIENKNPNHKHQGLQIGFTIEEMADCVEGLLKGIGLVKDFAPLLYIFGHGASSVNNTHYAGYDCGACSGRAGSVNARVGASFGNHPKVRELLASRDIHIPTHTQFIGALHDTTRDEMEFYDTELLSEQNLRLHQHHLRVFETALDFNARERSRRFQHINSKGEPNKVHERMKIRALSLFEPRPEWNHATNALCIIGKRDNNKHLFLDKRAFLNSYDYSLDPGGKYLLSIFRAVAPVCGGINLEYYFSRMDNERLGAGSKLPHNVMGLIGVANGVDGDLRPGLPKQMINIHDPLRILITVEHFPEIILNILPKDPHTYNWFYNDWVKLVIIHPETKQAYHFSKGEIIPYIPITTQLPKIEDMDSLLTSTSENLPVYLIA